MKRARATFKGTHPNDTKLSASEPIKRLEVGEGDLFYLVLSQNIGAPAKALVQKGDKLKQGSLIAEAGGFIGAKLHSPVAGTVEGVATVSYPSGKTPCIVIKADGTNEYEKLPEAPLAELAALAGIVGMGGAAFPTQVKLSPKEKIDTLIINGAECEPYLTCDHRLMLERTADLIEGALLIKEALELSKVIIGVEANKHDAALCLEKAAGKQVEVVLLPQIYPQGGEKQLIHTITGREVPEGKLPSAISVLVHNVSTVLALYDAHISKRPLTHRVVTVSGDVNSPSNVLAPIGTPISRLIEAAGGISGEVSRLIIGGPMTGFTVPDMTVPIVKGTNGVLAFINDVKKPEELPCIRCARCIRTCPMGLSPLMLEQFASKKMYEALRDYKLLSCIECSACNYVCPSVRPLKTLFRLEKTLVAALK